MNLKIEIYNKNIGINSGEVLSCLDYDDLRKYKLLLEIEIGLISNKLDEMKIESDIEVRDTVKYIKLKNYKRIQVLLLKTIDFQMSKTKTTPLSEGVGIELKFWKEKVKKAFPLKYDSYNLELSAIKDSLNFKS